MSSVELNKLLITRIYKEKNSFIPLLTTISSEFSIDWEFRLIGTSCLKQKCPN